MKLLILILLLLFSPCVKSQKPVSAKVLQLAAIGFWNVENLYDTLNDKWKNDEDFTPEGTNAWTGERYRTKIDHLSEVIEKMATDATPDGLALLGLCEVENKKVLTDLVESPRLKKRGYRIVHFEGPDARGIDPALLYNPLYFKPGKAFARRVVLFPDSLHKTRDVLVVSGLFLGEKMTVLVNHWPSRRGGERQSRNNRISAAKTVRRITDSIAGVDPQARIVIMGDFNDDPVNESIKTTVGTYGDAAFSKVDRYFNPMEKLYLSGLGSLAWQDSWNLFDQVLLSQALLGGDYKSWQFYLARVYNKDFLKNEQGRFKGYPLRTYSGPKYTAGYSDHFPVYILLAKEK